LKSEESIVMTQEEPIYWYDIVEDALASLEMLSEQVYQVITKPYCWKWSIIAMHSTLQAFMGIALAGSNNYLVIRERHQKHWIKLHEDLRKGQEPEAKVMELEAMPLLYERIKDVEMMGRYIDSKPFTPNEYQDKCVQLLHDHRSALTHFMPTLSLGLYPRDLAFILQQCLGIVKFLAFESENMNWYHYEPEVLGRVTELIHKTELQINNILKEL
jgi:hypothetical protein